MARTKKKALWVATESTYGSDPSASGAGYLWIPTLSLGQIGDDRAPLPTDYFTGRNFRTAPIVGPDGWSLDFEVPLIGLASAAGDGVNASTVTDDWLDRILTHVFGAQATTVGEGVDAGAPGTITLDTDVYDAQELIPVWESGVPTAAKARVQWCITTDNGVGGPPTPYAVAPNFEANPTTAGVVYGVKNYRFDDDGGATLSFVFREDELDYTLLGGRCTKAIITASAGAIVRLALSFRGDSRTQESKGSLPAAGSAPGNTSILSLLSPFWFGGTAYATDSIEVDLGITASVIRSTAGAHGRGGDEMIMPAPVITVRPLRTDALLTLKRGATKGRALVQFGSGAVAGGILNGLALHAEEAVAESASLADDEGRLRDEMKFTVTDKVEFSAGVAARFIQLARG